jgi:hypothetical protein
MKNQNPDCFASIATTHRFAVLRGPGTPDLAHSCELSCGDAMRTR